MMENASIPKHIDDFEVIDMSDGVVIKINDILHTLNSTAYEIFELCDGKRTIHDIIDEMSTRYPDEDIEPIVTDFINQLYESELLYSEP